jgi:hypothetical protein
MDGRMLRHRIRERFDGVGNREGDLFRGRPNTAVERVRDEAIRVSGGSEIVDVS